MWRFQGRYREWAISHRANFVRFLRVVRRSSKGGTIKEKGQGVSLFVLIPPPPPPLLARDVPSQKVASCKEEKRDINGMNSN